MLIITQTSYAGITRIRFKVTRSCGSLRSQPGMPPSAPVFMSVSSIAALSVLSRGAAVFFCPPRTNRNRVSDWIRVLYKPEGEYQIPLDIPGTLYIDGFQGDRPSGLSLHETADGRRVWRWHGRMREQKLR